MIFALPIMVLLIVALALASLRWPILMALAVLFTMSLDYIGRLGIGVLTANNLLKSLLLLLFALRFMMEPRRLRLPAHLLHFIPFILVVGIGVFHSDSYNAGLLFCMRMIFIWAFAIVLSNVIEDERHLRWVVHAMAVATLLTALLSIVQALQIFQSGPLAIHGAERAVARGVRVSGAFWNPNKMAVHLAGMLVFLFAALPDLGRGKLRKGFYILVMAAALVSILLSLSRSGYIAVCLAVFLFLFSRRHRRATLGFMGAGATVLALVLLFTPYRGDLISRFASFTQLGEDVSGNVRLYMVLIGFDIFSDGFRFIWGVGVSSFPRAMESHLHHLFSHDIYYHAGIRMSHNFWITVMAELGLLGIAAISFFFRGIYRQISLLLRQLPPGLSRSVLLGLLIHVTVKVVDFNFNAEFGENLFWYSMGLLGALGGMAVAAKLPSGRLPAEAAPAEGLSPHD